MPQAAARRARPGAATSAPPGSPGNRAQTAAGPRGRSPCPAAPPAPTQRRAGPPTSHAPRAKPAWSRGRAGKTQAATTQHPGVPTSSFSLKCPKPRGTATISILVFKPRHAYFIQVAWSRQGRTGAFATLLRHRRRRASQHPRRSREARAVKSREFLASGRCTVLSTLCPDQSLWGGYERFGQGRVTAWGT